MNIKPEYQIIKKPGITQSELYQYFSNITFITDTNKLSKLIKKHQKEINKPILTLEKIHYFISKSNEIENIHYLPLDIIIDTIFKRLTHKKDKNKTLTDIIPIIRQYKLQIESEKTIYKIIQQKIDLTLTIELLNIITQNTPHQTIINMFQKKQPNPFQYLYNKYWYNKTLPQNNQQLYEYIKNLDLKYKLLQNQ